MSNLETFGSLVWAHLIQHAPEFSEHDCDLLELAEIAGLCREVTYDPEVHGYHADLVPYEDQLWVWINHEESTPYQHIIKRIPKGYTFDGRIHGEYTRGRLHLEYDPERQKFRIPDNIEHPIHGRLYCSKPA